MISIILIATFALSGLAASTDAPIGPDGLFKNPIVAHGSDPWVVRHDGWYYYCYCRGRRIGIRKARRLEAIGEGLEAIVWRPPPGRPYSRHLWAPELHRVDGRWYLYVAADDGRNENHRMFALEGAVDDPMAPYHLKGRVAAPKDRWAIDGTVYQADRADRLYFIWSGWEGFEDGRQDLYIAPMSNPWTISGPRVKISTPTHDWEKVGEPIVNEGPEILEHGEAVHLIYSASGSWTDDYKLGRLTLTGDDPLDPSCWTKHPEPVFSKTREVFGPGHASFTTSPDGFESWIVYHAARHAGAGWDRDVRIQPFAWDDLDVPRFGQPITPGAWLPVPSGSRSVR